MFWTLYRESHNPVVCIGGDLVLRVSFIATMSFELTITNIVFIFKGSWEQSVKNDLNTWEIMMLRKEGWRFLWNYYENWNTGGKADEAGWFLEWNPCRFNGNGVSSRWTPGWNSNRMRTSFSLSRCWKNKTTDYFNLRAQKIRKINLNILIWLTWATLRGKSFVMKKPLVQ